MPSAYEKLSKACLSKWFTTSGELKPNYKHALELDTIVKPNKKKLFVHWRNTYNYEIFFVAML